MTSALLSKLMLELLVVLAALLDLRSRRIPNWLTGPGILAGLAINSYQGELKKSLLGFLLAFAVYGVLFALRAMGGGDVKLMTAVGAFAGPEHWLWIFALTSVAGGFFAIITLLTRGGFTRAFSNIAVIFRSLTLLQAPHRQSPELDVSHASARTLPHGAAIAAGTLLYSLLNPG